MPVKISQPGLSERLRQRLEEKRARRPIVLFTSGSVNYCKTRDTSEHEPSLLLQCKALQSNHLRQTACHRRIGGTKLALMIRNP
jgi:hypothetical protein